MGHNPFSIPPFILLPDGNLWREHVSEFSRCNVVDHVCGCWSRGSALLAAVETPNTEEAYCKSHNIITKC